jgi:hypothetical protein
VGNTEPAKAVETLFLDSEFFENRIQRASKEVGLERWRPRSSSEKETLLAVSNEIAEHVRNGWMQVNLTESTCRLRSLDSTLPYGLCNRNRVGAEVLHFETKQFHIDLHFTNSQSRGDGSGDWNPRFFRRTAGLGCIARFGWAQLVRRC